MEGNQDLVFVRRPRALVQEGFCCWIGKAAALSAPLAVLANAPLHG
jgi:hypothetical protein